VFDTHSLFASTAASGTSGIETEVFREPPASAVFETGKVSGPFFSGESKFPELGLEEPST
jgi:hypothetical protein